MNQRVKIVWLCALLALSLWAYTNNSQTQSRSTVAIPKDVTYTIIKKYVLPNIKRTLDVRLNRRISQDVLRSIAIELKNSDPKRYERTFITYYLPDMKFGTNAGWATTHFNPDLEVSILGLTVEQEESFFNEPEDSSREIVGTWYDENPSFVVKFTIYRQDGKLYVEEKFKDGSGGSSEVVEKASPTGQEFQKKSGSTLGSYYLIDRQGNLQVRYQEGGLFAEAKKIK